MDCPLSGKYFLVQVYQISSDKLYRSGVDKKEDEPMHGSLSVIIWIVLLALLALAVWKRRWWPFAVYLAGFLVFFFEDIKGNGGWEDLADFAMLIAVVIPIYIVGSVVWLVESLMDRHRNKRDKTHS
jgi:uncharacterized membrane protein YccC